MEMRGWAAPSPSPPPPKLGVVSPLRPKRSPRSPKKSGAAAWASMSTERATVQGRRETRVDDPVTPGGRGPRHYQTRSGMRACHRRQPHYLWPAVSFGDVGGSRGEGEGGGGRLGFHPCRLSWDPCQGEKACHLDNTIRSWNSHMQPYYSYLIPSWPISIAKTIVACLLSCLVMPNLKNKSLGMKGSDQSRRTRREKESTQGGTVVLSRRML
jgi:hypothetical protein